MAPLHSPGLDENCAGANLYPAWWICSKNVSMPSTNYITAVYNFCTGHQNKLQNLYTCCAIFILTENYMKEEFFCSVQNL